ncbi:hypothetical protein [Mycolicibacterium chlorophenolicum]|uniref:DUF4226 domain-containing protein n=1 Tax=Mycolicibacterium chlorophenolicum TaxID=37916 RepID=A0A0J6VBD7_9MYCO|nr:hypothetical protein [Mycolicibacterium chlorophenolicum]KMO67027.1 hypothetical protein MCHLDSM_07266 [Mycolicibacterium chlorophenolicum]
MSLMQTCAEVEAVIARARSLFGSGEAVDVPDTAVLITQAAQSVTTARSRTADLSGTGVQSYQAMAEGSVPPLTRAAGSDTALAAHVTTAAAVTQAGAARMDQIAATTSAITKAAPTARSTGAQRVILTALRSQVSQASQVVQSTQQQAAALAGKVRGLEYPKDAPVQALDHDLPQSPAPGQDPPRGKDPRYWIDVTKIIHVPEGQLAPFGTRQIGPGLYYPYNDQQYNVTPPPPPAKYPLDMNDILQVPKGQLAPWGTKELSPGFFSPSPSSHDVADPPWSAPEMPIDIREVIEVPEGQLAPPGYKEYLPGWFAPDPSAP